MENFNLSYKVGKILFKRKRNFDFKTKQKKKLAKNLKQKAAYTFFLRHPHLYK